MSLSISARCGLTPEQDAQLSRNLQVPAYAALLNAVNDNTPSSFDAVLLRLATSAPESIDTKFRVLEGKLKGTFFNVVGHLGKRYPRLLPLAVAAGAYVNQICGKFFTPLVFAVLEGSVALVRELLDLGADPNNPRDIFTSPLREALMKQDRDIVQLLLQRGADPNNGCEFFPRPLIVALFSVASTSLAQLLVEHGADWRKCEVAVIASLEDGLFDWFVKESGFKGSAARLRLAQEICIGMKYVIMPATIDSCKRKLQLLSV